MDDHAARTVRWLSSIDPQLTPTQHSEEGKVFLELPRPAGAEYGFRILLLENEFTLAAVPTSSPESTMFWHQSVERLGAASWAPVEQAFRDFVLSVISAESRITHRRGWLLHRFTCEVHREGGWERVGGQLLVLRTHSGAPRLKGRTREYRSPALTATAK